MTTLSESRRDFLKTTSIASTALFIGFNSKGLLAATGSTPKDVFINPFVKIERNGVVTVISKHFEMGQGTTTGLTTLVAEELDANWLTTKVEFAPADAKKYANLEWGAAQGTGGSRSMPNSFIQYREAGAAAREVLVKAAAKKWSVSESSIGVSDGYLFANGNKAHFGEFIDEAANFTPSKKPILKDPKNFKFIGNEKLNRKDNFDKTTGRAMYSSDVKVPGMVYVVIIRSPKFGGTLESFDASGAKGAVGFIDAKALPNNTGVAVYGKNTWAVFEARKKITTSWDFSKAETRSTEEMIEDHKVLLAKPVYQAKKGYTTEQAVEKLKTADKFVEADFFMPFLAHSPMEPVNCVIEPTKDGILLHDACQIPTLVQGTLATVLKIKPEQIQIKTYYAGGSFGRRVSQNCDYLVEAALAFDLLGRKTPVKLLFSREDDVKGGWYRPMATQKVKIGLDNRGNIVAWDHRVAVKSIAKGGPFESVIVKDGIDHFNVESISDTLYDIPNQAVGNSDFQTPIPVLWWRAVGHTQNVLAMESLMDMVAYSASRDPIELRLSLLQKGTPQQQRFANVIKVARDMSGWKFNQKRGFASSYTFRSFLAVVADVTVKGDEVHVDKLYVAVDCGVAINPDIIKAQLEGGMGYGLSAIARSEITFKDGEVEQSNFPNYPTLRMAEMPEVEVKIVSSNESPGGIGEPGTPIVGPAVTNAIFAVTGKRITEFPLTKSGLELV